MSGFNGNKRKSSFFYYNDLSKVKINRKNITAKTTSISLFKL